MPVEPLPVAYDGRTLFDFAKLGVGLAWQPDHGGVPIRRSSNKTSSPALGHAGESRRSMKQVSTWPDASTYWAANPS